MPMEDMTPSTAVCAMALPVPMAIPWATMPPRPPIMPPLCCCCIMGGGLGGGGRAAGGGGDLARGAGAARGSGEAQVDQSSVASGASRCARESHSHNGQQTLHLQRLSNTNNPAGKGARPH